jgi:hypothetical protein
MKMKIGVTGGARLRRVRYKKMPVAGKKRSNSVNLRAGRNAAPGGRARWGETPSSPNIPPPPFDVRCSRIRGGARPPRASLDEPSRPALCAGSTRSLEFFRVRISREGAGNSARGGRAPHFSVRSALGVGRWALNVRFQPCSFCASCAFWRPCPLPNLD